MKTLYEKALKCTSYIKDIIYMQTYYMENYNTFAKIRVQGRTLVPSSHMTRKRSYTFQTNDPDDTILQLISIETDYASRYVMALTSSFAHIKNNKHNGKYTCAIFANENYRNKIKEVSLVGADKAVLACTLLDAIENDTIKETEFQLQLIHSDFDILKIYYAILLNDDLVNIQKADKDSALCLSELDVKVYVPARKAFVDLLEELTKNDWRTYISQRYGHNIK